MYFSTTISLKKALVYCVTTDIAYIRHVSTAGAITTQSTTPKVKKSRH